MYGKRLQCRHGDWGIVIERTHPRLSAALPEDWFYKESITLLHPEGIANVIFSSEPLDESITTEKYAGVQGELLRKEFPDYTEFSFEPMTLLGGRSGFVRRFEWRPPDGTRVSQMQIYFADSGRGYTATATAPTEEFAGLELMLSEMLAELDLVGETAPAPASST